MLSNQRLSAGKVAATDAVKSGFSQKPDNKRQERGAGADRKDPEVHSVGFDGVYQVNLSLEGDNAGPGSVASILLQNSECAGRGDLKAGVAKRPGQNTSG